MNSWEKRNLKSAISILLVTNVSSTIIVRTILENLIQQVTKESEAGDEIYSFKLGKEISIVSTKDLTEESATTEAESTIPAEKANIPREWRHNASYA